MQDSTFRETIKVGILAVSVFIAFGIVFYIAPKRGDVVRIDCTWSEISPDFSPAMREACRQARAENYQKNLQKPK
jgi:steroid 5-alpha reductase family enzyme